MDGLRNVEALCICTRGEGPERICLTVETILWGQREPSVIRLWLGDASNKISFWNNDQINEVYSDIQGFSAYLPDIPLKSAVRGSNASEMPSDLRTGFRLSREFNLNLKHTATISLVDTTSSQLVLGRFSLVRCYATWGGRCPFWYGAVPYPRMPEYGRWVVSETVRVRSSFHLVSPAKGLRIGQSRAARGQSSADLMANETDLQEKKEYKEV